MAGAERFAELKHSAKLGKTFPVGGLGENEAKAQHSWGLGLAELGKKRNYYHLITVIFLFCFLQF